MLGERFAKTWQRAPNSTELKALVDDYVLEEIYYRKALQLGLDQNDPMIRRRLRQKMEFFDSSRFEDTNATDAQLTTFLHAHPEQYQRDARFSFEQLYFKPIKEDALEQRLTVALQKLHTGELVKGDASSLPAIFNDVPASQVERIFGRGMVAKLSELPIHTWSGAVRSGLGVHLIRIHQVQSATLPELSEIKHQVQADWLYARQEAARKKRQEQLLEEYKIEVISSSLAER